MATNTPDTFGNAVTLPFAGDVHELRGAAHRAVTAKLCAALLLGSAWTLSCGGSAHAASYNETTQGDASNDRLNPTRLVLSFDAVGQVPGSNVVNGTVGRPSAGAIDRDYFHIVVPQGFVWTELRVGNQVTTGGGQGSFIGLAAGATVPVLPSATSASGLLGWTLYSNAQATTDILDDMGLGHPSAGGLNGASGFTAPLPAGDYTLWLQETATGSFTYRFNLLLSPVPEPSGAALGALGALAALVAIRSRSRRHRPS